MTPLRFALDWPPNEMAKVEFAILIWYSNPSTEESELRVHRKEENLIAVCPDRTVLAT